MNSSIRSLCWLCLLLLTTSCGKQQPEVRDKTFLVAEAPVKISDLLHGGLARSSRGDLFMTAFVHSTAPSATEAYDAIAVFHSNDDGATWQEISRIPSFITTGVWGYDLVTDENDRLYATWVAAVYGEESPSPFKAIMFSRSDDGGRSWTEPVHVNDVEKGQRWQPVMAVSGGRVYIAWLDDHSRGSGAPGRPMQQDVYFASSPDRGETWSASTILETAVERKEAPSGMPSICVGADGTIYCAYFSTRERGERNRSVRGCWIAKSTNGGATFTIVPHDFGPLGPVSITEQDGRLYLASVHLRGIKSLSLQAPQTSQEIRLYVSSDGGKDWDEPVLIDDDPDDTHKMNLRLVALGEGRLIACWDDDRDGVYMAASTDGGASWGKNVSVAERSPVGSTPLDIVADGTSGTFILMASHIREGPGDAIFLVSGQLVP